MAKEIKYSKGSWEYGGESWFDDDIKIGCDEKTIARIEDWSNAGKSARKNARKTAEGNARLIVAACNAFIKASDVLGVDAVTLAERFCKFESGGIGEIAEALRHMHQYLADTGKNCNPETGKEYASCKQARKVIKKLEL